MSFNKAEVAKLTKLVVDLSNDTALASRFVTYMLEKFPREALRFYDRENPAQSESKFKPFNVDCYVVGVEVQEWLHNNVAQFNRYTYSNCGNPDTVGAIRELRRLFGLSLREAKYSVEAYPFPTY